MLMKYIGKKNIEVNSLMILGGSPIGEMVAKQMAKELDSVKLIELNKEKCLDLSEKLPGNVIVVNGDGRNSDMLIEESIKDFDAFVAVTNSSETNILACVAAKSLGVARTIAEVENIDQQCNNRANTPVRPYNNDKKTPATVGADQCVCPAKKTAMQ